MIEKVAIVAGTALSLSLGSFVQASEPLVNEDGFPGQ